MGHVDRYDTYTAAIFEEVGIPVLLVGDSAGNNVFGYDSTLPVTADEMLPLVSAVSRPTKRALIIAELPFGSYQGSPEQCFHTAVRFVKEGGAHAVMLEGGIEMLPPGREAGGRRDSSDGPYWIHPAGRASTGRLPYSEQGLRRAKVD